MMKNVISLLFALLLVSSCFTFYSPDTNAFESEKEDTYRFAQDLYDEGHYLKAYYAFQMITGYKDVDTLLKEDQNLRKAVAKEAKLHKVGSRVSFGMYEQDGDKSNGSEPIYWWVLACKDKRSLLISCVALDCQPYNKKDVNITWEQCSLRNWLNTYFLENAFSEEETNAIIRTNIKNDPFVHEHKAGEASYGGKKFVSGGRDTSDYVFLLSYDEANQYFNSYTKRLCQPSKYASELISGILRDELYCYWWLRSPGSHEDVAREVSPEGTMKGSAVVNSTYICVRPAIWIDLEKLDF